MSSRSLPPPPPPRRVLLRWSHPGEGAAALVEAASLRRLLASGVAPKDVNERRNAVIAPLTHSCFMRTLQAVEAAVAAGEMRSDMPARAMTEALVSSCHGLISIRLANPIAPWSEPEIQTRVLLDGLFNGFSAK